MVELLIDHANCEKKAASTALNLIYKYIDKDELLHQLSRMAREELRHFEQVLSLMLARNIEYIPVSPSRYAGSLREDVRTHEPARLTDILIMSAVVEARSCERFEKLAQLLEKDDPELAGFYQSLLKSEGRHFSNYLMLASQYGPSDLDDRIQIFLEKDRYLIESADDEFRFHSGIPPL